MITDLNDRAQKILRHIVDAYLDTGEPIGSRTISRELDLNLSPATIRNVMADLEDMGVLYAPHTSAGRLPTQAGMRLYIDGLMEIGNLSAKERRIIEAQCKTEGQTSNNLLEQATSLLSGLSEAASLVIAPKTEKAIRQIQFIEIEKGKALVVMVMEDNMVENRIMAVPKNLPPGAFTTAANYLNERLKGRNLQQARKEILKEIETHRASLDTLTADLVKRGIARAPATSPEGHIIVRGQSKLLEDVKAIEDLEKARQLLAALEDQETVMRLLNTTQDADGVQIFIGSENQMFDHSGWSMILSPYKTSENKIIGAIGVIGPVRLNYGRVIPVVDYTAEVMGRILGGKG